MDYPPSGPYPRRRFNYDELLHQVMAMGWDTTFILKDPRGQIRTKVYGKERDLEPPPRGFPPSYPSYSVITVNGITDIIEHRKMEPIFYVTDDPAIWKKLGVGQK